MILPNKDTNMNLKYDWQQDKYLKSKYTYYWTKEYQWFPHNELQDKNILNIEGVRNILRGVNLHYSKSV